MVPTQPDPPPSNLERFEALLGLDSDERRRELDRLRRDEPILAADLGSLLAHDAAASTRSFLPEPADWTETPVPGTGGILRPGTRIGPYEVRELLGRGGMGAVYLAHRIEDYRQPVALKLMRPGLGDRLAARFHAERQILATLDHPGIVRLLDGGTTPHGAPYLVMEYVRGARLDDHCRTRTVSFRDRARLVLEIARAIAYAHDQGILHRDLKPSNILVGPTGEPKITDFGLARFAAADTPTLTDPGNFLGTLGYMAPEQILGGPGRNGPGIDVYALGVILYGLAAGRLPFDPELPLQGYVRAAHEEPPSLRRLDPTIPRNLDTIVRKALNPNPADRFASASAFAEQLRLFLDDKPLTIRPPATLERLARWSARHRNALLAWAASFTVVLLTMLAILAAGNRDLRRRQATLLQTIQKLGRSAAGLVETSPPGDHASFRYFNDMTKSLEAIRAGAVLPATPSLGREVALMHRHLATALLGRSELAAALQHIDKALALLESVSLHLLDPDDRVWHRFDRFRCLSLQAIILQQLGDATRSLAVSDEALHTITGIVRDFPADPAWREAEARLHAFRAELLLTKLHRADDSRREAALALELASQAVRLAPDKVINLNTLIVVRARLSDQAAWMGQQEEQEAHLRAACVVADRLAQLADPDDWTASDARIHALGRFARFLIEHGRTDEARPLLIEATRLCDALLARVPENPVFLTAAAELADDRKACGLEAPIPAFAPPGR